MQCSLYFTLMCFFLIQSPLQIFAFITGFILFAGKKGSAPLCTSLTGVEKEEEEKVKEWKSLEEKEGLDEEGHQDDSKVLTKF